jgi:hypothetical protein
VVIQLNAVRDSELSPFCRLSLKAMVVRITYECPVDPAIDLHVPTAWEHIVQVVLIVFLLAAFDFLTKMSYKWSS